jgi:hypothetical protein
VVVCGAGLIFRFSRLRDLGIDDKVIFVWITEVGFEIVDWIQVAQPGL